MTQPTLQELKERFDTDDSLPLSQGNNPVFGEGPHNAKILAIGEAPGFHEDQQKRPFIGRSGQLLRKLLVESGIDLQNDIYITNIVKHRPPENRDPTPEEIEAYREYLDLQLQLIKPEIIITLGRFSMNKFIPNAKISLIHGQAHWVTIDNKKTMLLPMYHPAAALRGTTVMNIFKQDFAKLKSALDYFNELGSIESFSDSDNSDENNAETTTNTTKTKETKKPKQTQLPLIT